MELLEQPPLDGKMMHLYRSMRSGAMGLSIGLYFQLTHKHKQNKTKKGSGWEGM